MASELGLQAEDLKDPAKVKEAAEKIEAENKAAKEPKEAENPENKILSDQLGRLAKALEKRNASKDDAAEPSTTPSELSIDDQVFARMEKLSPEKVEILKDHAGLSRNKGKSFEEIAKSSAVKAEFKDLQDAVDAADEIDTNANDDKTLETKNETYEKYKQTGKEPESEYERKVIVAKELERMRTI